ncbi:hypothetical protein Cni_G02334 [Canna indica]|uniref:Uncharacterized protein n=1 Tax=Canna indica TaxID=4628 RepID=A0AAQ3JP14_9LILI|nr:hypothetical protein Cni_G02334 [Canna indica]
MQKYMKRSLPHQVVSFPKADGMTLNTETKNPFQNKSFKEKESSLKPEVVVEAFKSNKPSLESVKVNLEKNSEALHRKLSDILSITLNKIQENEGTSEEVPDIKMLSESQSKAVKIRKASIQTIHVNSFPLNIKQNRAKKRRSFLRIQWPLNLMVILSKGVKKMKYQ